MGTRLPTIWEARVRSLNWKDPLEKEMANHSSTLAWKIPWTEEHDRYSPCSRKELDTTELLHFHFHFHFTLDPRAPAPLLKMLAVKMKSTILSSTSQSLGY